MAAFLLLVPISADVSAGGELILTPGLILDRAANLIANGSFEIGGPNAASGYFWAEGTTWDYTPVPGWVGAGGPENYAMWDNTFGFHHSAPLPDGTHGLYFGNEHTAVSPAPTFSPNGTVTFASPPIFTPVYSGYSPPVTLRQTVNLSTDRLYKLSFWTSGENASSLTHASDGVFGLDVTGFTTNYLTAAGGQVGGLGASHKYTYLLHPATNTTTITFTNWGHLVAPDSTELVMDDVILNYIGPGDANMDGSIDGSDIALWAINFTGALGPNPPNPRKWSDGDFNFDGSVDGSDVALWAQNFTGALGGPLSPIAVVPEPAFGLMVFWFAAAGLRPRRSGRRR